MIWKCGKKKKGAKKYLMLAILLAFVFVASSVYAESMGRFSNYQNVKTYVVTNTTATGAVSTSISTSTINPLYHRILGFTMMEYNPLNAAERIVALYDCAAGGETAALLKDEIEVADNLTGSRWYPYPMQIDTQLTVRVGANCLAVIYYEDKREI